MRSYTTLRNLYGMMTNDSSSANLTLGDQLISDSIRAMVTLNGGALPFLEITHTLATVASQSGYTIPQRMRKLVDLYVTVGTTIYTPRPIYDADKWKLILRAQLGSNDVAMYYYREGNTAYIQPAPGTTANTITFRGRKNVRDLSVADYTTGTITSIANGATTVTGSGTTWTDSFEGRFIRIPVSQGGDGYWYEIASRTSNTVIELLQPYQGDTIAAATATYTIGEMSILPESYDIGPVYRAAALFWATQTDPSAIQRARQFWLMYDGGVEAGINLNGVYGGIVGNMLLEAGATVEGPYIEPFAKLEIPNPNFPPTTINPTSFT